MGKGQQYLIKLICEGDEAGNGKGHTLFTHKTNKLKDRLRLKKYCNLVRKHLWYKETK